MTDPALGEIEIYAVGLLADLRDFIHSPYRDQARRKLRQRLRYPVQQARHRNWPPVKSYLNGYLTEPQHFPPGLRRCGTGWTRGRAYRDLLQHAYRAGAHPKGSPR